MVMLVVCEFGIGLEYRHKFIFAGLGLDMLPMDWDRGVLVASPSTSPLPKSVSRLTELWLGVDLWLPTL